MPAVKVKINSLLTEKLMFLFSFEHSIGLIVLISTTLENEACSESFVKIHLVLTEILKAFIQF